MLISLSHRSSRALGAFLVFMSCGPLSAEDLTPMADYAKLMPAHGTVCTRPSCDLSDGLAEGNGNIGRDIDVKSVTVDGRSAPVSLQGVNKLGTILALPAGKPVVVQIKFAPEA